MENNFEFRIWDTELKRWRKMTERPDKCLRRIFICPDGLIVEIHDALGDTMFYANNTQGRFELSQSIGRKDSKGVKAFTGDILKSSVYDRDHCEIVFRDGGYCVLVNNEEWHPIHDHFTVVGNKWEGIFPVKDLGPETRTQSSAGGDSTVQQEGNDGASSVFIQYDPESPLHKVEITNHEHPHAAIRKIVKLFIKESLVSQSTKIIRDAWDALAQQDKNGAKKEEFPFKFKAPEPTDIWKGANMETENLIINNPEMESSINFEEFAKEMRDIQEEVRGIYGKIKDLCHKDPDMPDPTPYGISRPGWYGKFWDKVSSSINKPQNEEATTNAADRCVECGSCGGAHMGGCSKLWEKVQEMLSGSANDVLLHNTIKEFNKAQPGLPEIIHEREMANELLSEILRAKHRGDRTGIEKITELIELITYKVDTRKA